MHNHTSVYWTEEDQQACEPVNCSSCDKVIQSKNAIEFGFQKLCSECWEKFQLWHVKKFGWRRH